MSPSEPSRGGLPAIESRGHEATVRAGQYAVVRGSIYRARFAPPSERIGLFVWEREPAPEGFRWDDRMGGYWYRSVPRSSAERLFEVRTWALYQGVYPVHLDEWTGAETLRATYLAGPALPADFEGYAPIGDDGAPVIPPGFARDPHMGRHAEGVVRVDELTDHRGTEHELPLEPQGR